MRYGANTVLSGVQLGAVAGTVTGILGPSGAGKSTLFRAIAGELSPATGCIRIGSLVVDGWPLWRRARVGLGWVPQGPSVLAELSVEDNLRTFARAARRRADVAQLAERAGLGARRTVRACSLSGGERRRLELVRALVAEPKVLLCDEPMAGVDPVAARGVAELLRDAAAGGAAVVVADHRVREVLAACDDAVLLAEGRVELRCPATEFAESDLVRARYLGG